MSRSLRHRPRRKPRRSECSCSSRAATAATGLQRPLKENHLSTRAARAVLRPPVLPGRKKHELCLDALQDGAASSCLLPDGHAMSLYSMHVPLSCLCSMRTDNVWFFQFKPPSGQHSLPELPSDFQASMANQDVFLILHVLNVVTGLTLQAFSRTKPPPARRCPRPLPLSWPQARPRPRRRCCEANRRGWQAPFHSGSAASSWCQRSPGLSLQTSVCQTCITTSPSTACGADRPGRTLGMLGMPGHAPTAEPVSCPACQQACSCHVVCQHRF